jgi:hypothetical protein
MATEKGESPIPATLSVATTVLLDVSIAETPLVPTEKLGTDFAT